MACRLGGLLGQRDGLMRHGRVDKNQKAIVSALRQIGATVQVLSDVGKGCPDLLVAMYGINYLLEVKDGNKPPSKRRLTPAEQRWHMEWNGQVAIVNSVDEAIRTVTDD